MDNSIFSIFSISFLAIGEIFVLIAIGFFTAKRRIIKSALTEHLSELVIYVTLPLMIFSRIITEFSFTTLKFWWIFPLISIGMIFLSFILAGIAIKILRIKNNLLEFKSLVSFQNSGYLPLALVSALLKPQDANTAILYILFFLMGFNFLLWSWGITLLAKKGKDEKIEWSKFFSPPFIAVLIGLFFVLIEANKFIPQVVIKPLKMLGDSTIPLGLFIVGAALADFKIAGKIERGIISIICLKLMIIPLIFLWIINLLSIPYLIALVVLLEAAMPSAASLIVIAKVYRENHEYISQGILLTHLVSLITIPAFLILFFSISR